MFNLYTTFASIFPFCSSGIYSQFHKITARASRLSLLVGGIAIYAIGRKMVSNYLYREQLNNLSNQIRETNKENKELAKENNEIVDKMMGVFKKVIDESNKGQKKHIEEIVDFYEKKLKESE